MIEATSGMLAYKLVASVISSGVYAGFLAYTPVISITMPAIVIDITDSGLRKYNIIIIINKYN